MVRFTLFGLVILAAVILIPENHAFSNVDPSCQVSVQFTAEGSQASIDGKIVPRQNPDGTYYPGDAFDFTVKVSWTYNCWRIYPQHLVPAGVTLSNLETGSTYRDPQGNGYFYEYGHAEISPDARSGSVSQAVGALGLVCDISKCSKGYTSGTGSYVPGIIKPRTGTAVFFANLTDRDGYLMRNKDGTFYPWDGINLVYSPDYKWRQAREGTLVPVTDYTSDIPLIGSYKCHKDVCQYSFSKPAITTWHYQFRYGEGHTAFNSTLDSFDGIHVITYHTTLYNIGRKIGGGYNSTSALVVQYRPVFVSYPYVVLKDTSSWWGFGKTPSVALHYLGSTGGGKDDGSAGVHKDRRSKVNGFSYSAFAYRVLKKIPLNESLTWQGSYPADFSQDNFTYQDDSLQAGAGSAMFVHSGYGKIFFYHPILHTILETRLDNSSLAVRLESENFGGFPAYNLTSYILGYPHTRFSTDVIAISLHGNGSINPIPLSVTMVPDTSENATYEQDFVRQKVTHDMDKIFAGIVLGDMYGKQDSAAGTGLVNMRANLTAMAIPDVYKVFAQDPLDLPLSLVYEQPSPYNITIMAGPKRISFVESAFEFDTNWRYVINTDTDNSLNASRYQDMVTIFPDKFFGPYSKILIDGIEQNTTCTTGCALFLENPNASSTVTALNPWGGMATKKFPPPTQESQVLHPGLSTIVIVFMIAGICLLLFKTYQRSASEALGFSGLRTN